MITRFVIFIALMSIYGILMAQENESSMYVTFKVSVSSYPVIIKVKTNLPDDTKLLLTLRSKALECQPQCEPRELRSKVTKGIITSGHWENLPPGDYWLDITVAPTELQTKEIQEVFGRRGEYLSGPYIERGRSLSEGPKIHFMQSINIPSLSQVAEDLIKQEGLLRQKCSNTEEDRAEFLKACEERGAILAKLKQLGMCWDGSTEYEPEEENNWVPCDK